jgi:two-component system phosphate regulon response regulator PhoB
MSQILLADGNARERKSLEASLRATGHAVIGVADGMTAIECVQQREFDLVLTDSMLRDMSGLELASTIRRHANGRRARFLIVSAKSETSAITMALDSGADDYLVKPVRSAELQARVNAALRRPPAPSRQDVIEAGPIRLDRPGHRIMVSGSELDLAPIEFRLMVHFMENPGRVMPRCQLLEQVWRRHDGIGERTVDVHVRRLRAALEPHGADSLLQTVRGFGYRFG